jgi:hypothetical protein
MAQDKNFLVGRRRVLISLGALAGITAASGVATASVRKVTPRRGLADSVAPADAAHDREIEIEVAESVREPGTLFGLPEGTQISRWTVAEVHPLTDGAIPVIMLDHEGTRFQVDVVRRDDALGAPRGVADTKHFSVFVANKGSGSTSTVEEHGRGAMMLGRYLEVREAEIDVPAEMMTLVARNRAFPSGTFLV